MLLFGSCLTSSQIPCQNKNHLRFKENKMQTKMPLQQEGINNFPLVKHIQFEPEKVCCRIFHGFGFGAHAIFFSQPRSNTLTFSTFSIQDSRPHLLTFSMFIILSQEGEGGMGQWVKCCILGCLFVSVFICEKTGRRSWARRWMGSLCPETNKQWSESQHTHTHARRAWVGHLDARWTLTWKEKQGEACYRRTHLHTHTHAHAGHRCPSLAHAVASEVAHDLGLVVSNRSTEEPVISDPRSTTKTTTKSSFSTTLIAATWFTASSAWKCVLLATRVIKIHKPKIGNTHYCDSSLQTRSPAASFFSPLSEATCQSHKPPLWCGFLILAPFLTCSLRSSTNATSFGFEWRKTSRDLRKTSRDLKFKKKKKKSTKEWNLSNASSQILILKSGSKLHKD